MCGGTLSVSYMIQPVFREKRREFFFFLENMVSSYFLCIIYIAEKNFNKTGAVEHLRGK